MENGTADDCLNGSASLVQRYRQYLRRKFEGYGRARERGSHYRFSRPDYDHRDKRRNGRRHKRASLEKSRRTQRRKSQRRRGKIHKGRTSALRHYQKKTAALGIVCFYALSAFIPAENVVVAIVIGGASGFSAIGTDVMFRQFGKKEEVAAPPSEKEEKSEKKTSDD